MKKRTKLFRIVAVVLTISVLLSTGIVYAFAEDLTSVTVRNSQIVSALRSAENYKGDLGLSDVDFSDITVANPLQTYYYTDSGLDEGIVWYPLKAEGELVAFAIEVAEGKFVIDTDLVEEINKVITDTSSFAIIYDEDSCSLYDGVTLSRLATNATLATERGDLQAVADLAPYASRIDRTGIAVSSSVGYTPKMTRSSSYIACSGFPFVTQQPYVNICWAASIAAITNYMTGTSYTAYSLAQSAYNRGQTTAINVGMLTSKVVSNLNYYTNRVFAYRSPMLSASVIYRNISYSYPVLAFVTERSTDGYYNTLDNFDHVVVICGVDVAEESMRVMDPARTASSGFVTAVKCTTRGGYHFYRSDTGYFSRISDSAQILT